MIGDSGKSKEPLTTTRKWATGVCKDESRGLIELRTLLGRGRVPVSHCKFYIKRRLVQKEGKLTRQKRTTADDLSCALIGNQDDSFSVMLGLTEGP
jgi:hypothetical protein